MDKIANVSVLRRKVHQMIINTKQCKRLTDEEQGYVKALAQVEKLIDKMPPYIPQHEQLFHDPNEGRLSGLIEEE